MLRKLFLWSKFIQILFVKSRKYYDNHSNTIVYLAKLSKCNYIQLSTNLYLFYYTNPVLLTRRFSKQYGSLCTHVSFYYTFNISNPTIWKSDRFFLTERVALGSFYYTFCFPFMFIAFGSNASGAAGGLPLPRVL